MADTLRIAIAQFNPTVGALDANVAAALEVLDEAVGAGADLLVLPEMAITGYPPEDLVLKPGFLVDVRTALETFAAATAGTAVVVGFAEGADGAPDEGVWNAVAVCAGGAVQGTYRKRHLPNYDVFDEVRHFRPGIEPFELFEVAGVPLGITICEDSWITGGPVVQLAEVQRRLGETSEARRPLLSTLSATPSSEILSHHQSIVSTSSARTGRIIAIFSSMKAQRSSRVSSLDGSRRWPWPGTNWRSAAWGCAVRGCGRER